MPMSKFVYIFLFLSLCIFSCSSGTSKGSGENGSKDTSASRQDSVESLLRLQKYDSIVIAGLNEVVSNLIKGNVHEVAVAFKYPIERQYPLSLIEDSVEFVKNFKDIISDEIIGQLVEAQKQGWKKSAAMGWSFCDGAVCSKDGKEITKFMLLSKKAKNELDSLVKEELQSLDPSLQNGWTPYQTFYCKKNKMVVRIDSNSGISEVAPYRIAIYDRQSDLKLQPTALMFGVMELQGEALNKYFQFSDATGNSAELYIDSNDPTLDVLTTVINDSAVSVTVKKDFWLNHL